MKSKRIGLVFGVLALIGAPYVARAGTGGSGGTTSTTTDEEVLAGGGGPSCASAPQVGSGAAGSTTSTTGTGGSGGGTGGSSGGGTGGSSGGTGGSSGGTGGSSGGTGGSGGGTGGTGGSTGGTGGTGGSTGGTGGTGGSTGGTGGTGGSTGGGNPCLDLKSVQGKLQWADVKNGAVSGSDTTDLCWKPTPGTTHVTSYAPGVPSPCTGMKAEMSAAVKDGTQAELEGLCPGGLIHYATCTTGCIVFTADNAFIGKAATPPPGVAFGSPPVCDGGRGWDVWECKPSAAKKDPANK